VSGKEYAPSQAIRSWLVVSLEDIFHSLYGLLLHVGEDVRVGVEGLSGLRERRIHRAVVSPSGQVTRVPL
jgi:hypothetical protein